VGACVLSVRGTVRSKSARCLSDEKGYDAVFTEECAS